MSNYISNHVYRNIISSIVNSTPDRRVGCRPDDLVSYVKEVFEFDEKTHKVIVDEETANKPEFELYVTLIEGRNIASSGCGHGCPYCILTVSKKGMSSNSLQVPSQSMRKLSDSFNNLVTGHQGHDATPRLSDAFDTQMQYSNCLVLQDTEMPRWNEEFRFFIGNERKQNLVINVLRSECVGNNALVSTLRTSHSVYNFGSLNHHRYPNDRKDSLLPVGTLKSVVSALTKTYSSPCNCKGSEELIGTCNLFLKDLPVNRVCEKLLPIVRKKSALTEFVSLSNSAGSIRVKLRLASKANSCISELPEADHVITLDDVASVIRRFHLHNSMRQHQKYDRVCTYGSDLPDCSDAILDQFLISNNFQRLTRSVINLSVLLEWHTLGVDQVVTQQALQFSLERVRNNYMETPAPFGNEYDSSPEFFGSPMIKTPCPSYQIDYLYERTIQYLNYYLNSLTPTRVRFFPPCSDHGLETFGRKLNEFCFDLCRLELWMWGKSKQPFYHFRRLLTEMIQSDTKAWFHEEKNALLLLLNDQTIQYVGKLTNILNLLDDACRSYSKTFEKFFQTFEINYDEIVVPLVDAEISEMIKQLFRVFTLSQRHVYYDREMLQNASKRTSKLYFAVGRIFDVLNESKKDTVSLEMSSYQLWFTDCLELWFHTTKVTCYEFIMKAAQKDVDLEKAAANVNFTASTVDTLAICKGACDEFIKLQLSDPNTLLLATIKLCDIICDNIIAFSRHLYQTVLTKHCNHGGKVQILRAANSICHVGQYLSDKLPEFLQVAKLFQALSTRYGKESQEYDQAKMTFSRLACSTREIIDGLAAGLIEMIMQKLKPDIEKYCASITEVSEIRAKTIKKYLVPLKKAYLNQSFTVDNMENLLRYLEKCLHALRGGLQAPLFELSLGRIWTMTMDCIRRNTQIGQAPAYYEQLHSHLKMLDQFFDLASYNQEAEGWFTLYMAHIELQAQSTADLILGHYAALSDLEFSPSLYDDLAYKGQLQVKVGYQRVSGEKITVFVKIIEGIEMPNWECDSTTSTPSIRIVLCPQLFFPGQSHRLPMTMIIRSLTLASPEDTIEFTISESYPYGSTLGFFVISSDCLTHSDLAGMAFVHLGRIPQLSWKESVDDMSIVTLPLLVLTNVEQLGSSYQVLKQRRQWDTTASDFVRQWDSILTKRITPLHDNKMPCPTNEKLQYRVACMISRGTQMVKATAANVKRLSQPK